MRSFILGFGISMVALAQASAHADDLSSMSLEELFAVEVTSVAKRPQSVDEAASAIFVITQKDIKATGATSIPELLRLVPGMEVAELDGNITGVSARGFNWRFSNKMLVLVDGRAVYLNLVSGVLWDTIMLPVEDIDRIEVIRGPGATLYGANAVNGVINIVSKHAVDTLGTSVTVQAGVTTQADQKFGRVFARQGGRLGKTGALRLWATGEREPTHINAVEQEPYANPAHRGQVGFRADWEPSESDAFTLQGDLAEGEFDEVVSEITGGLANLVVPSVTEDNTYRASSLLGRWSRTTAREGQFTLQAYYSSVTREEFGTDYSVDMFDIDFSHYFSVSDRLEAIWGLNYRYTSDEFNPGSEIFTFEPAKSDRSLYSSFLQGDAYFFDRKLRLSLGTKLEYNDFTGFEVQPSIRGVYVTDKGSVWGAVSRAVRTPSRFERDVLARNGTIPPDLSAGVPFPIDLTLDGGGNSLRSENMISYEIGARRRFSDRFQIDVTAYLQDYTELAEVVPRPLEFTFAPVGPGGALVPIAAEQIFNSQNGGEATVKGIEAHGTWRPTNDLTFSFAGNLFDREITYTPGSEELVPEQFLQGLDPDYQASFRADYDFSRKTSGSAWVRHVAELENSADAYTDLDIRLSHRILPTLEVTLLGENLIEGERQEFSSTIYPAPPGAVERRVSLSLSFRR